jgi:hypothetical protein
MLLYNRRKMPHRKHLLLKTFVRRNLHAIIFVRGVHAGFATQNFYDNSAPHSTSMIPSTCKQQTV